MTNEQFEHHYQRMLHDQNYKAGFKYGLAGTPAPSRFQVTTLSEAWHDGWSTGVDENARAAAVIADWMSGERSRQQPHMMPSTSFHVREMWIDEVRPGQTAPRYVPTTVFPEPPDRLAALDSPTGSSVDGLSPGTRTDQVVATRSGPRDWVVELGDTRWPSYLTMTGSWSPTLGMATAWFLDRLSAEACRPNGTPSRTKQIVWPNLAHLSELA